MLIDAMYVYRASSLIVLKNDYVDYSRLVSESMATVVYLFSYCTPAGWTDAPDASDAGVRRSRHVSWRRSCRPTDERWQEELSSSSVAIAAVNRQWR